MSLLVHGVRRALAEDPSSIAPQVRGGDATDAPTFLTVTEGPLAGIVSETDDEEAMPTRANLLHHTRVLEHLCERTTVVPMRFGVLVPDADALASDFLVPERDRLVAALDRLDDHVELRLRGRYVEAEVIRDVLEGDPRAARLRGKRSHDAKLELGERIVAGIDRRRDHDEAEATATLRAHASAATATTTAEPLDAFTLSFLVSDADRSEFEAAVDRLGGALAPIVTLELVGPVPPFSFAEVTEDAWA